MSLAALAASLDQLIHEPAVFAMIYALPGDPPPAKLELEDPLVDPGTKARRYSSKTLRVLLLNEKRPVI